MHDARQTSHPLVAFCERARDEGRAERTPVKMAGGRETYACYVGRVERALLAVLPLSWSTSQAVNDALGTALRPSSFNFYEEDDERDGYPDKLQFVVTIPVDADSGERAADLRRRRRASCCSSSSQSSLTRRTFASSFESNAQSGRAGDRCGGIVHMHRSVPESAMGPAPAL